MLYGIEVYQLWPQAGPFWLRDAETGERQLFDNYGDAVRASDWMYSQPEFNNFSFRAVEYKEDQGG